MSETNQQNFEPFESAQGKHNSLEADIERLSKEIAEKRNLLEHKNLSERELLKKSLEPMIKRTQLSGQRPATNDQRLKTEERILPDYFKDSDSPAEIRTQVEKLINSVFHRGIISAAKEAQKSSGFVLDLFHDALTDKLYEELKKRKLI